MNNILDDIEFPNNDDKELSYNIPSRNKTPGEIIWSFGGGAVKWISLAEGAKVSIKRNGYPTVVIGVSAGALLAPIIAVSKRLPDILDRAINIGRTLKSSDIFPYKGNSPFNKKGKPTVNAIFRILTGYNHLGFQDIGPLYKSLFTDKVFAEFKKSDILCYAFGVKGKDFSPSIVCLNDAKTVTELIAMIELSSRIVPFVQPAKFKEDFYIDGGFVANNAAWVIREMFDIKELITFYTNVIEYNIKTNDKWDGNILQVVTQCMGGMAHWHSIKDRLIEEYYCKANCISYMCIEYPCSAINEVYDTDDNQLEAAGIEAREITEAKWTEYFQNKNR